MLAVFAAALAIRVTVAVGVFLLAGGLVFEDSYHYNNMATAAADARWSSLDGYYQWLYVATGSYLVPVTALYKLFTPTPLIAQLLSAVLGAGAAAVVTRLAMEVTSRRWSVAAGMILAVLPSQVLWSSMILKEAPEWLITAGLGLVVALAGRTRDRRRVALLAVAAVISLILLRYLRTHILVVAAWALALASWTGMRQWRWQRGFAGLLIAIIVPWALGLGPAGLGVVDSAGPLESRRANNALDAETAFVGTKTLDQKLQDLEDQLARAEDQAAEMRREAEEMRRLAALVKEKERAGQLGLRAEQLRYTAELKRRQLEREQAGLIGLAEMFGGDYSTATTIQHLPRGLSIMLLWPYPWQGTDNSRVQFARMESFFWYPVMLLSLIGVVAVRRNPRVLMFPLLFGGGTLMLYALTEGNAGTAYRHRGEFVWVVALFAALGARAAWRRLRTFRSP